MFNSSLAKKVFLFLILAELLSLFAWFLPEFNMVAFFVILFVTLILSLHKLEYGIYIILAELFIASEGYLFSFEFGETLVSIRIGLFLVVMAVWLLKFLQKRKVEFVFKKQYAVLGIIILWGFIWGIVRGNDFGNVFLDFNNWLYFLMVLPIYYCASGIQSNSGLNKSLSRNNAESTPSSDGASAEQRGNYLDDIFIKNILTIFITCVIWLGIKSLILLYIFSHQFVWALPEVYKWVRDTRVGEVTLAGSGFYRVFLQSQIFSLLTFFILLSISNFQFLISKQISNFKFQISKYLLLIICLTTVILSFSRSYWVGLAAGLVVYFLLILLITHYSLLITFLKNFAKVLIVAVISFGIVFLIINLPPRVIEGDLASLLGKRATELGGAGASRINQLKPLGLAIAKHPIIGSGFGTTLTYITNDPRVVPATAGQTGEYTTYAFEWGYLDMVLKFGLFGLAIYLILIFSILRRLLNPKSKILNPKQTQNSNFQNKNNYELRVTSYGLRLGFGLALIALLVVNIFSPYLNHPLGIGFIIISSLIATDRSAFRSA